MLCCRLSLLSTGPALHWLPYYMQCNPCAGLVGPGAGQGAGPGAGFRPATVIHLETWARDTQHLLDTLGLQSNRSHP